jgi:hypothetical protein
VIAAIQDEVNERGDFDRSAWAEAHPEFRTDIERFFGFENFFENVLSPASLPGPEVAVPGIDLGAFPIRGRQSDGIFGPVYLLSGVGRESDRELVVLPMSLGEELRERFAELVEIARPLNLPGLGLPRRLDTFDEVPILLFDHVGDRDLAAELGRLARGARLGAEFEDESRTPREHWGQVDRAERRAQAASLARDERHLAELLRLFALWARRLDCAHRAGVIHGALAPEDFVIDTGPQGASIRRIGLGPAASGLRPEELPVTRRRWLAPEIVNPSLGNPGFLSDVHGFGLVLATALSLDLPHWSEADEVVLERVGGASEDIVSWLPPTLSPELMGIVRACTARDPRSRPVNLERVALRLDRVRRRLHWSRARLCFVGALLAAIVVFVLWLWLRIEG